MTGSRFNQTKVWADREGKPHKITKMDPQHVKFTIAYLRRNADEIASREGFILLLCPDGSVVAHGERMIENPRKWLESTPLVRELVRVDIRNEFRIAAQYGAPMAEQKHVKAKHVRARVGGTTFQMLGLQPLGEGIFASAGAPGAEGSVINWRGVNYVPQGEAETEAEGPMPDPSELHDFKPEHSDLTSCDHCAVCGRGSGAGVHL